MKNNKEKLKNMKGQLEIMKALGIKSNFSELEREKAKFLMEYETGNFATNNNVKLKDFASKNEVFKLLRRMLDKAVIWGKMGYYQQD